MKKTFTLSAAIALMFAINIQVLADENAGQRLSQSLINIGGGILELPATLNHDTKTYGPIVFPISVIKGGGLFIRRELYGLYELFTSPLPIPNAYRLKLEPENPVDYFK